MLTNLLFWVKKHYLRFAVGGIYLGLCLWIGEVHPFTLVPMYNSFPNYGYAFYITDEHNKVLPIKKYFSYQSGNLGHYYNAVASSHGFATGFEMESAAELAIIGQEMMAQLAEKCYKLPPTEAIVLHRACFTLVNDSIEQHDVAMHQIPISSLQKSKP
jgi:hypothetical protein